MTGTCTMHDTCKLRQCAECEDALPPVKTVAQEQKWLEEFEEWYEACPVYPLANLPNDKRFFSVWQAARAIDAQRIAELEAKVDWLMLEYCPEEMTPEQVENWKANQRARSGSFTLKVPLWVDAKRKGE